MANLLPVNSNGSLAAIDPPLPSGSPLEPPPPAAPPMGPPSVFQQLTGSLGLGPTTPPGMPEPPATNGQPGQGLPNLLNGAPLATGSSPDTPQMNELEQRLKASAEQRRQIQQRLKELMSPDGVKQYLPNGGKQKPSEMLADALFNMTQLNLRNPIYGSLQGQAYKPIQQQRMEQALQQHTADIQNMTLLDKSLAEQNTSDQYLMNQERLQKKQEEDLGIKQQLANNAIAKAMETVRVNSSNIQLKNAMLQPSIDLKSSQTAKNRAMTDQIEAHGGDPKTAMQAYLQDVYPDDLEKNGAEKATLHAAEYQKTLSKALAQGGVTLSPAAVDFWARFAGITGQLPSLGMGASGAVARGQILNRAPEIVGGDVATNRAVNRADSGSLAAMQKMRDAVVSFEKTSTANLDNFVATAKGVVDSGSPWINVPMRLVDLKGMGNADLAAYNAARRVAINEIAKVTSNPTLAGQLSNEARKEVENLLPEDATLGQVYSVAAILKRDMANRHKYLDQGIQEITGRLASPSTVPSRVAPPPAAPSGIPQVGGDFQGKKVLKVTKVQ